MRKRTALWIEYAERDLHLAEDIVNDEYYARTVTFLSHQAVEKIFKAVLEDHSIRIPKEHDLLIIYKLFPPKLRTVLTIDSNNLENLNDVYADSRYPGDEGLLPNGIPTQREAEQILTIAKPIFAKVLGILKGK